MDTSSPFLPGMQLCERLYHDGVAPILERHFPHLPYAAARLGSGSEVLGFDTSISRNHDWGPQVELYLTEADFSAELAAEIGRIMGGELPFAIDGHPTHFEPFPDLGSGPDGQLLDGGHMSATERRPIRHKVTVRTVNRFLSGYLGANPLDRPGLSAAAWLTIPEQHLRTVVSGRVFRDDSGELERARHALRWYPHDVWLYVLAAQWRRIAQEEAFMARCGDVGDDLGSRIVAARVARELMHLCFSMERQYAPYSKWFGTAFARLECGARVGRYLGGALAADTWPDREEYLSLAYTDVANMHNALAITEPLSTYVSAFHASPYRVIHADRFCEAIRQQISDEHVLELPRHAGSTSQWVDSTDVQTYRHWFDRLRGLYAGWQ